MKYAAFALALLAIGGCSTHYRYTDNAHWDYRSDSFSTVNHCLHSTQLRCR